MNTKSILILTSIIVFIVGVILLITGFAKKSGAKTDDEIKTSVGLIAAGSVTAGTVAIIYAIILLINIFLQN